MVAAGFVLLQTIDAWIGAHPELLVNTRKRGLAPIVKERTHVAEHLFGLLKTLGLKKRQTPLPSLHEIMARSNASEDDDPPPAPQESSGDAIGRSQRQRDERQRPVSASRSG